MHKSKSTTLSASGILLALMLAGCGSNTLKLQPEEDKRLPALPEQARASRVLIPSECSPTCLSALKAERKRSQDTLINSGLLANPVSEATTP